METKIYNVLIGGVSVGMTFKRERAVQWLAKSMYQGKKEIKEVAFREAHETKPDYNS